MSCNTTNYVPQVNDLFIFTLTKSHNSILVWDLKKHEDDDISLFWLTQSNQNDLTIIKFVFYIPFIRSIGLQIFLKIHSY